MPHLRQPGLFVIDHDFTVAKDNVAAVVFALVAINRHQPQLAAAMKHFRNRRVGNRQIRITVKNEELFAELGQRAFDGAAGAEQFFTVKRIVELDAVCFIAEFALDHFTEKADAQHGVPDTLRVEHFELMRQNRPAGDGHERLGNLFRDGPQPRGEAAREDGNGDLGKRKAHELFLAIAFASIESLKFSNSWQLIVSKILLAGTTIAIPALASDFPSFQCP